MIIQTNESFLMSVKRAKDCLCPVLLPKHDNVCKLVMLLGLQALLIHHCMTINEHSTENVGFVM